MYELKEVPGFGGRYLINKLGEVYYIETDKRKKKTKRRMSQRVRQGYFVVRLNMAGQSYQHAIHRLLAQLWIDNPEHKAYVNHKNGIKTDNRIENLEWCTGRENQIHGYRYLKKIKDEGMYGDLEIDVYDENDKLIGTFGNQTKVAKILGTTPQNISSVMRRSKKFRGCTLKYHTEGLSATSI